MATLFYFDNNASPLGGAGLKVLSQSDAPGNVSVNALTTTVAGGTQIQVTQTLGGQALSWISQPIYEGVTISGTVTPTIIGGESAASVNARVAVRIERCNDAGTVQSTIIPLTGVGTELPSGFPGPRSANITPTATTMGVGERIKITLFIINSGTMGNGSATLNYYGAGGNATFLRFTENILTDEIIIAQRPAVYGSNGYRA